MSAIVLAEAADTSAIDLTCVSLATGTKCLPVSSIPKCRGTVLHDSHAEVLALRAFNLFLLSEMDRTLQTTDYESKWVECQRGTSLTQAKPFLMRSNVSIHLFSTEAPCGDASMGLLIGSMSQGNSESWPEPLSAEPQLHGRGYFSMLGAVRRKPSRGDAEPTLSKSCTDKLALKQFTSVLTFPASLFIEKTANTFIKSIILPADKYEAQGFARAFDPVGRLRGAKDASALLTARHFQIDALPQDAQVFTFSRISAAAENPSTKACNVSALWVAGLVGAAALVNETLVNGVKQGSKQFGESSFKASALCRERMWHRGRELANTLQQRQEELKLDSTTLSLLEETLLSRTYRVAKAGKIDNDRAAGKRHAIEILGGWQRNEGDDDWGLGEQSTASLVASTKEVNSS